MVQPDEWKNINNMGRKPNLVHRDSYTERKGIINARSFSGLVAIAILAVLGYEGYKMIIEPNLPSIIHTVGLAGQAIASTTRWVFNGFDIIARSLAELQNLPTQIK